MDNRLSLSKNITAVTWTCRFFLYNIRRIRSFLTTYSTQLLIQAMVLSRLDYCNSLLAGLPASAIRPLQLIQNAAARLIFNAPKYTHTTQLLTDLHWLPVIARIKFKDIGACIPGSQGISPRLHPTAHQTLHTGQTSTAPLPLDIWHPLPVTPSQLVHDIVMAPRWWNDLPVDVRTAETLSTFKRRLKTHLFRLHLSLPPSLPPSLPHK